MKKRSIVTVVEEILKDSGQPLHYKEITKLIFDECQLSGKTPHETVRSRMALDSRFKRVAEGVFALTTWKRYPAIRFGKDIAYDILAQKGKPLKIEYLAQEIYLERKFASNPKVLVRNIVRSDQRFYYDPKLDQVGLAEWKSKK